MARLKLLQQLPEVQQEMSILDDDTRCLEERINTYKSKYPFLPVIPFLPPFPSRYKIIYM